VAKKTLYVKDEDLSLWDSTHEALRNRGSNLSAFFTDCMKNYLQEFKFNPVDGFLHVLRSDPTGRNNWYTVMFAPTDKDGALKPHYCHGIDALGDFLRKLGLTEDATRKLINELAAKRSASSRISLTQEKINLI
jgi:hypothetical protein